MAVRMGLDLSFSLMFMHELKPNFDQQNPILFSFHSTPQIPTKKLYDNAQSRINIVGYSTKTNQ